MVIEFGFYHEGHEGLEELKDETFQETLIGDVGVFFASLFHFFFFFVVCLNFKTAKFNSIDVSVSVVSRLSSRSSAIISPLLRIRAFCLLKSKISASIHPTPSYPVR